MVIMKSHLKELNKLKEQGFNLIPINEKKRPIVKEWQKGGDFELNGYGVGLVCGLDKNIEVIDIDCKYDLTGNLFDNYKKAINNADKNILKKLVVQKTVGGGYHFFYKCNSIQGNKKLANRYSTETEKEETYVKEYNESIQKGDIVSIALEKAKKAKEGDKVRVLIETRGIGGYVAISPTNGYSFLYKDLYGLEEITLEEREVLFSEAIKINEIVEESKPIITRITKQDYLEGLTPWEDYNNRGDVHSVLNSNGWKQIGTKGSKVLYLRPGQTSAAHSGNFDEDKNWFSVFTTSSQFEPQKAYNRFSVYATLECNGDFTEAAKKLYNLGYGDRRQTKKQEPIDRKETSKLKKEDISSAFKIIEIDDVHDRLKAFHTEGAKPGVKMGFSKSDEHYTMKLGSVTDWIGFPQSGKTELLLEFLFITSVKYGWKHLLCVPDIGDCIEVMAILIHKHTGKTFDKKYPNYIDWNHAYKSSKWILEHFKILEPQNAKNRITPVDFWEYAVEYKKKYGLNTATIDSWKDMYHDYDSYGGSYAKYLSEVLPIRNMLAEQNELHFHTVIHPKNPRRDEKGKIRPPQPDDMEGGAQWNNSGKCIISVHRDGIDTKVADISVLKVKPRVIGKRGFFCLNFDPARSRYYEIEGSIEGGINKYATDIDHGIGNEIQKSSQFPGLIVPEEPKEPKPLTPNQEFDQPIDLNTNPDLMPF